MLEAPTPRAAICAVAERIVAAAQGGGLPASKSVISLLSWPCTVISSDTTPCAVSARLLAKASSALAMSTPLPETISPAEAQAAGVTNYTTNTPAPTPPAPAPATTGGVTGGGAVSYTDIGGKPIAGSPAAVTAALTTATENQALGTNIAPASATTSTIAQAAPATAAVSTPTAPASTVSTTAAAPALTTALAGVAPAAGAMTPEAIVQAQQGAVNAGAPLGWEGMPSGISGALSAYGQGVASQDYECYFNRIGYGAGLGQAAASALGGVTVDAAGGIANTMQNYGDAITNANLAQRQITGQGLSNLASLGGAAIQGYGNMQNSQNISNQKLSAAQYNPTYSNSAR